VSTQQTATVGMPDCTACGKPIEYGDPCEIMCDLQRETLRGRSGICEGDTQVRNMGMRAYHEACKAGAPPPQMTHKTVSHMGCDRSGCCAPMSKGVTVDRRQGEQVE
jgi:hypothetical protein